MAFSFGKKLFRLSSDNDSSEKKPAEKFYYTIQAPKSFRPNSDFIFSLTIHDANCEFQEPVIVRATIQDKENENGFKIERDATMQPNATEIVTIPIGDVSLENNYILTVKGISGITLDHTDDLDIETQKHTIFIQTDKAIYKPNDCIKYRVLVLDTELKAASINNNELNVQITDPSRNLLKKLDGVNTINGVYSGEYQLSDVPSLGDWKIKANILDQEKVATIEVAKYVLPKFEVVIEAPEYFTFQDEVAKIVVRAKYTHGKPLRGTVVVSAFDEHMGGFLFHCDPQQSNSALATKTVIMDGRENVEFDLKNELKVDQSKKWYADGQIKFKADFTETLTGLTLSTEKSVTIYKNAYVITTDLGNKVLQPDTKVDVTVSVRKRDGSLVNFINPERRNITIIRENFTQTLTESKKNEMVYELDQNCDAHFTLDIAKDATGFSLKSKYVNEESEVGTFYVSSSKFDEIMNFQVKVLTEKCLVNKEIEVEILSPNPLPSYTYLIIGRGRILETKTISTKLGDGDNDTNNSKNIYHFSFTPNFDYAPRPKIIVYCIQNRTIVSAQTSVELMEDFKNYVDMDVTSNTAKPGQLVDINIKSNPNSYIGLLGIDKSVLLLRSGNDLSSNDIWDALESSHKQVKSRTQTNFGGNDSWWEFSNAGLITFSNAEHPVPVYRSCGFGSMALFSAPANALFAPRSMMRKCKAMSREKCAEPEPIKPVIRKEFPETWIWETFQGTSAKDLLSLRKKVPDSLTTWILTGFSIDPLNGLAITKKPCELLVQQQFHISLNLPYSVKRGEILTVPCSIFNYLPNEIDVDVTMENEHNEFEFVDSAVSDQIYPEIMKQQFRKKKLTIASQDAVNALFSIRPIKVGLISLKVSAISNVVGDCVIKTLNVECEGVPQFVNKAVYIDLREKTQIDPLDLQFEIPKIALPDSTRIEITCVGDLLGGTIKNLQNLIRIPYGCGEQNMLNFVPNIVVLNYLKNTHQLTVEIEAMAKKYMEIGYQRELTYKHEDGSFSAFGESDKSGSTWLTAFVARSFRQAAEHIAVSDDIINESLKWLSEKQASDGSFTEKGSVCHKEMQSGSSNGVALTAYVLTAFLVNKNSNGKYEKTIQKAIENIIKSIENCSDVYALAVSAYALQLANHESKNAVVNRLLTLAKSKENQKWWDKSIEMEGYWCKQSKTLNVETTAYALLTLQSFGNDSECLPILKWLLNQRNDQGGFEGTQDTILGIEALASFATKISTKNNKVNIDVSTSTGTKFNFAVNADNSLVLQSQKLTPDVKSIHVNANGNGFALLELGYRYHINASESEAAFSLKPSVKMVDADHMSLEITTAYQPPKGKDLIKQSNMVVMETTLPSGFVLNTELLNGLKDSQTLVKRIETKSGDTVAIIYLDHLTSDPITFEIDGFREHLVEEQKPASILIYDYYDNALSAREFYSLPTTDSGTDTSA